MRIMFWNSSYMMGSGINIALQIFFENHHENDFLKAFLLACIEIANAEKLVNHSKIFLVNYVYPYVLVLQ